MMQTMIPGGRKVFPPGGWNGNKASANPAAFVTGSSDAKQTRIRQRPLTWWLVMVKLRPRDGCYWARE